MMQTNLTASLRFKYRTSRLGNHSKASHSRIQVEEVRGNSYEDCSFLLMSAPCIDYALS